LVAGVCYAARAVLRPIHWHLMFGLVEDCAENPRARGAQSYRDQAGAESPSSATVALYFDELCWLKG
jgi:hypothetical protein